MIVAATEHITITLQGGGMFVLGICLVLAAIAIAYGLAYFGKGR